MSRTVYYCDLCNTQYSTLAEAVECEARHVELAELRGFKLIGLDHKFSVRSPSGVPHQIYVRDGDTKQFMVYEFKTLGHENKEAS